MLAIENLIMARRAAGMLAVILLFSGCSGGNSAGTPTAYPGTSTAAPLPSEASTGASEPITLRGTPPITVILGNSYWFQPTVSSSSTIVTFKISGLPPWGRFDPSNGALSGTPSTKDQGTTGHVTITASNATNSASLTPFTIQVKAPVARSTKLSWSPPTENTDGTPLTDLEGYKIYYGTSPGELTKSITVADAASTTYVIDGLTEGIYYFAVVAYNSAGHVSGQSNAAEQTI